MYYFVLIPNIKPRIAVTLISLTSSEKQWTGAESVRAGAAAPPHYFPQGCLFCLSFSSYGSFLVTGPFSLVDVPTIAVYSLFMRFHLNIKPILKSNFSLLLAPHTFCPDFLHKGTTTWARETTLVYHSTVSAQWHESWMNERQFITCVRCCYYDATTITATTTTTTNTATTV